MLKVKQKCSHGTFLWFS